MGRKCIALLLVLTAAPAAAQEAAAFALGRQVYAALEGDGTTNAAIGALLRDSVNSLEGVCPDVGSYQVFRQTKDTTTLKVECSDRPLYLLSIDDKGRMLLSGGDGRVGPMQGIDGPIVVTGVAHGDAEKAAAAPPEPSGGLITDPRVNDEIPVAAVDADNGSEAAGNPAGWMRWAFAATLATIGLLAFLLYSRLLLRARTLGRDKRGLAYSSADKDRMIAEAQPVATDIWEHPSGLFIVRGRHGKRRLFPSRFSAHLYRRWGLKISQVR